MNFESFSHICEEKRAKSMSKENEKALDTGLSCRSLAEELLREMPDMKEEIEQELKDALSTSNEDVEEEKKPDGNDAGNIEAVAPNGDVDTDIKSDLEALAAKESADTKLTNDAESTAVKNYELDTKDNADTDMKSDVEDAKENPDTNMESDVEALVVKESADTDMKNDVEAVVVKGNFGSDLADDKESVAMNVAEADFELSMEEELLEKARNLTSEEESENRVDSELPKVSNELTNAQEARKYQEGVDNMLEAINSEEKETLDVSTIKNGEITATGKWEKNAGTQEITESPDKQIESNSADEKEKETESKIRKREIESPEDLKKDTLDFPIAKQPKLEIPNERKSIIEIHIANKVADDEEALAELERVRKLKEQSIIELHRLKSHEDKLLRLENINKQLQKNIEHKHELFPTTKVEESISEKNTVKGEREEPEKKVTVVKTKNEVNTKETNLDEDAPTACAETKTSPSIDVGNDEESSNSTSDKEISKRSTTVTAPTILNDAPEKPVNSAINTDIEMVENATSQIAPTTESTNSNTVIETSEDKAVETAPAVAAEVSATAKSPSVTQTATPMETANTLTVMMEKATGSVSIQHDESSNHSTAGEPDPHLPPEELTIEEEERDRELRESRATFLQHLPCFKLLRNAVSANGSEADSNDNGAKSRAIPRCRECRRRNAQGGSDVYCRFYEFRRLQYNESGELLVAGFPNPYTDPTPDDLRIWQPDEQSVPTAGWMDIQVARYILLHAGDQFCYLWQQEAEALRLHENPNSVIAWKKVVQGLREICDVCDTTLFNFHWTCDKCGFGVCLDCFKDRKEQRSCRKRRTGDKTQRGHDEYHWMLCTATTPNHQKHELRDLMLTQIIAGDALNVLGRLLHDIRAMWQVPQICGCLLSKQDLPPDTQLGALIQDMIKESQLKQQTSASSLATEETLRKQARMEELHAKKLEFARARGIDYVPGRVWTKQTLGKDPITTAFDNFKHINFLRKGLAGLRRFLPPRAMTLTYSTMLAPGVPHEWLCDGKLLRLTNSMHPDNRILFQEVWKCGQPVMISEVARSLNLDLWRPEAFCNDFGDKPNDLINCLNGNLVPNQPMRYFWEGFQCIKKRLLDASGKPMLLKLKDWPPGDDFAEILPTRFADLMTGLPMPEYTLRTGNLNIASCLPKMFVPPDLGPKMYNAYGSALHPDKGTTNLHLDISDAVNIMVYVGVPQDADSKHQLVATQRAIALGGCDYLTRARCQSPNVLPGALWHIFPARDADKIRDLLNRVTIEKGFRLEPDHDPIHDQNWYLDDKLRARLFNEYGVEGYPIVQCLGDAIFIPAGAPHQVQNLHNCIKVAEDFVSPENITHCYHLTHEFRHLSHSHTNHEDKLQIKNIIYHAIKDCCHILVRALDQRLDEELAKVEEQNAKAEKSLIEATELAAQLTGEATTNGK
ncbi:PREDICTED: lysine-specific demethylase 3A isoform X2 [Rhagoletis zephyria]|uniref:lysine-specific demethylase 3A isoform X2 n=1 Tax=Rhagoletis zephyria TaxID=28612 RepID=UPI00081127E4|nr:PREDICTED: lysine-specific demethylase 3A isoform X2 [Rhagoletis zephyria]